MGFFGGIDWQAGGSGGYILKNEQPGQRYEFELEVLILCARRRLEIVEVPIRTIYIDDNAASSIRNRENHSQS